MNHRFHRLTQIQLKGEEEEGNHERHKIHEMEEVWRRVRRDRREAGEGKRQQGIEKKGKIG
jgi:hypothetical protein